MLLPELGENMGLKSPDMALGGSKMCLCYVFSVIPSFIAPDRITSDGCLKVLITLEVDSAEWFWWGSTLL